MRGLFMRGVTFGQGTTASVLDLTTEATSVAHTLACASVRE